MRAVMLEVPRDLLAERRRQGNDRFDEMWEGVLHMVPPPNAPHQRRSADLFLALAPIAQARGLQPFFETGLFRNADDFRQPDLMFVLPAHVSKRGTDGAELVIEIHSPDDESREKLPFYARMKVKEVLLLHPETRAIELHVLRGERLVKARSDAKGRFRSNVLGVSFARIQRKSGPLLEVILPEGSVRI
ncbi:Uma2 family endonuclease [bacterium]|nr:Uma2 family endonuclease [bacterium]